MGMQALGLPSARGPQCFRPPNLSIHTGWLTRILGNVRKVCTVSLISLSSIWSQHCCFQSHFLFRKAHQASILHSTLSCFKWRKNNERVKIEISVFQIQTGTQCKHIKKNFFHEKRFYLRKMNNKVISNALNPIHTRKTGYIHKNTNYTTTMQCSSVQLNK